MSIQTIDILDTNEHVRPTVRLCGPLPRVGFWQCAGLFLGSALEPDDSSEGVDLNRAVQIAAVELAKKASSRQVSVEVLMEPLMPRIGVPFKRVVSLILAIGENASASVEPGPGRITIRTWWRGKQVGVDAVGVGGSLPPVVRQNIMTPGFSTRAGEWDTGFGLYDASLDASELGTEVLMFDSSEGIGFRLAIPLRRSTPASSPEAAVGIEEKPPKLEIEKLVDGRPLHGWDFPERGTPPTARRNEEIAMA